MSHWHGRMGRGAGRARKLERRAEAQARQTLEPTYTQEIGRVVREQNVGLRTARHVVETQRKISRAKAQYRAGFDAMAAGKPLPANASKLFRRGYRMALTRDAD